MVLCLETPATLLVLGLPHFIFPLPLSPLLLLTRVNLCPETLVGWEGSTHGAALKHPWVFLSSHPQPVSLELGHISVAPITFLPGTFGPTQFPGQAAKGNSCLLPDYEADRIG